MLYPLRSVFFICLLAVALATGAAEERVTRLPELVVKPGKHQALHLKAYVREYSTLTGGTDTVRLLREKTVDFMVPRFNAKGFAGWTMPRLLDSRSYYRFTNGAGLDSVSDEFREHFSWADWIGIFSRVALPAPMRDPFCLTDTIKGRNYPVAVWERTGSPEDGDMSLSLDILADIEYGRRWVPAISSYLDGSMDFYRLDLTYGLSDVGSTALLAENIRSITFDIESNGRGRNLNRIFHTKGPVYVSTHAEMYIVDREYVTLREARRRMKDPRRSAIDLAVAASLAEGPAMDVAALDMKRRAGDIDHAAIRLKEEKDKLLIGPRYFDLRKEHLGPIGFLWKKIKGLPGWFERHF